ncbi:MAG: D-alanyl-D-alanine carboxypeptidase [Lachnospiraceae bacterium]|nr:D-alanyl-D-alanine carboxypeptidase [Lachnospiraceae bacterium]MBQ5360183.1 D-alanyl-D-alanine carboxypeptidase [Lachnospiraceae bacterium]
MKKRVSALICMLFIAFSLLPGAAMDVRAEGDFSVEADAAILIDLDTGKTLYEKNADEKAYPASVTKIMTALLAVEAIEKGNLDLKQEITVPKEVLSSISDPDAVTIFLNTGEKIRVKDLLYATLLPSANDAASVLAFAVGGNLGAFCDMMNVRATSLGCTGTHFTTPNGLHEDDHYTTARDLAKIAAEAMQHDLFKEIVGTQVYEMGKTSYSPARKINNTNQLLYPSNSNYYEYAIGIKTGYTSIAGHCLAAAVERDLEDPETAEKTGLEKRHFLTVILGADRDGYSSNTSFEKTIAMMEHAYNDFDYQTIVQKNYVLTSASVALSEDGDSVDLKTAEAVEDWAEGSIDPTKIQFEISAETELTAPVNKGDVLGSARVIYDGEDYGSVDLVASDSLSFSQKLYIQKRVRDFLDQWYGKAAVVLAVLILGLVISLIARLARR